MIEKIVSLHVSSEPLKTMGCDNRVQSNIARLKTYSSTCIRWVLEGGWIVIDEQCMFRDGLNCGHRSLSIYWVPKLHKCPYKPRYIAESVKCSTKPLFKLLTSILSAVKTGLQSYCDTSYSRVVWIRCGFWNILKICWVHGIMR